MNAIDTVEAEKPTTTEPTRKNISIRSRPKNRAKKKAQYLKNKAERASLYSEFDGEVSGNRVAEWHRRLNALSAGTA